MQIHQRTPSSGAIHRLCQYGGERQCTQQHWSTAWLWQCQGEGVKTNVDVIYGYSLFTLNLRTNRKIPGILENSPDFPYIFSARPRTKFDVSVWGQRERGQNSILAGSRMHAWGERSQLNWTCRHWQTQFIMHGGRSYHVSFALIDHYVMVILPRLISFREHEAYIVDATSQPMDM